MSSDLSFRCPNLNSVNIIYDEPDKRIRHLTELLKRNGVSNLNLNLDGLPYEDDCMKMLYTVLYWINSQVLKR
jgi:hypothetical protein